MERSMRDRRFVLLGAMVVVGATAAVAQQPIPIRQLAPAEATSPLPLSPIINVLGLSDGRVLVNDYRARKILMLDRSLLHSTLVADSNTTSPGPYGRLSPAWFPYLADSTLLRDPGARTFLVMDPNGKVVRVMAPPRTNDLTGMSTGGTGRMSGGVDASGRLIYRGDFPRPQLKLVDGMIQTLPSFIVDSFPLIRADLETRRLDTIGVVHAPLGLKTTMTMGADNKLWRKAMVNPLPVLDDWALLSDGSVAIVRGHDYHIDWIYADGTHASTPKMPFDWKRLTDGDKQHLIDSAKTRAQFYADSSRAAGRGPIGFAVDHRVRDYVPLSEITDYYPPLRNSANNLLADRERNLWILPSTTAQSRGGLVYDVVNRRGELFERVQLPAGCALAGFGPDGDVFLNCVTGGSRGLQRTRVVR